MYVTEQIIARRRPSRMIEITTLCLGSAAAASGAQADTPPAAGTPLEEVTVSGLRPSDETGLDKLPSDLENTPQSIDEVSQRIMQEQATTRLQDALRYVPGVTLNSGEGGAHGDSINLRGFSALDDFFLDGIRDPGSYTRDNFDLQAIQVLEGPSAVLFGNGSAGGVINQQSKLPTLAPIRAGTIEFGTNDEYRGTADVNQPLGDTAALRLNVMGEKSAVADRDDVEQRRWGLAPSVAFGLGEPTTLTLSYFHQEEDNTPDYGIPFLFGKPAPVPRNLYYGLKDDDRTQIDANVVTAELKHDFSEALSVTDTVRYGNYWANWRVTAPDFASDFAGGAPAPGTPLDTIPVYRDRPSSEGTQTYLTNHTDLVAKFATGSISHVMVAGVEFGRQTNDLVRFDNDAEGIDGIAPTPLLAPDANEIVPRQIDIESKPSTTADTIGVYAVDTVQFTSQWSLNLGVRFDRYDTQFDEPLSVSHFERIDTAWSPRVAAVFKPTENQSLYVSYATSFDPPSSYLTLAPDNKTPAPETAKTYEIGAKTNWLGGQLLASAAAFRTDTSNVTISDPDDPSLQQLPGTNQRIQGFELSVTGYITPEWEVDANYTYLDLKITSGDADVVGRIIPRVARNSANLWTSYDLTDDWKIGTGVNYLGARFADSQNTASVPSYVVWNAMAAYQVTDEVRVQLNVTNITDAYYYDGAYYSDIDENHVIPGAGRTATLTASFNF